MTMTAGEFDVDPALSRRALREGLVWGLRYPGAYDRGETRFYASIRGSGAPLRNYFETGEAAIEWIEGELRRLLVLAALDQAERGSQPGG